jgi:hypothetical protein
MCCGVWTVKAAANSAVWWENHLKHSALNNIKKLTVMDYKSKICVFTATINMEINLCRTKVTFAVTQVKVKCLKKTPAGSGLNGI